MTALQADLLRRIQDFRFDPPASTYTFADRLAKENGWTRSFADRAIAEYRRFAYLAIAAGHPVSPSEVVDQVWHLHLIFTRSYWDDFCANTLGRPLHHEPSTGGYAERAKFADWSANTLTSYRVHFGAEPPSDIWLAPAARGSAHEEFRRVDVSRHWIVPKLRLGGAIAASLLAILLLLLAAGCSNGRRTSPPPKEWAHTYNPLDFTGPQFLTFYLAAFVAACCLAWRVRRSAAAPSDRLPWQVKLDAYAIAYLNGGPDLALDAAVAKLVDEGAITLDAATQRIAAMTNDTPQQPLHLLEQAVLSATRASSTRRIIEVRQSAKAALDRVAGPLIDLELIPDPSRANTARVLATMLAVSVPAVGALKVIVGLSRNRPVEFLLIACLVSVLVSCLAFGRRITRTRRGDQFLAELRSAHNAIRRRPVALEGDSLALGVGLFGISLLYGTVHAPLARALHPPKVRPADGSFGGGCGSHGSSCGGGGCGGGGCGGGGCGGCGGGS